MRLEGDKESLQLQVTVLTEQVEAQAEKITDLENLLDDKKEQLQKTEEQLQKVSLFFMCTVISCFVCTWSPPLFLRGGREMEEPVMQTAI